FYLVNPGQTQKLDDKALAFANVGANDTVMVVHSGIGPISLLTAQPANNVCGVSVVAEANDNTKDNGTVCHIEKREYVVGQAEKLMPWRSAQGLRPEVITVEPPRKGCDEALLKAMINMQPKRIVYVSCSPSTLARYLRILEDGGYKTQEVQP